MLSVHSLKTVGLSSCLECVQQCYNRGELRPLLLKAQSSSFIEPPPDLSYQQQAVCAASSIAIMTCKVSWLSVENQQRSHCICLLFIFLKKTADSAKLYWNGPLLAGNY